MNFENLTTALSELGDVLEGVGNAKKALSTPEGREEVYEALIEDGELFAAQVLEAVETIFAAAATVGEEME
jgi:hypothetical protein